MPKCCVKGCEKEQIARTKDERILSNSKYGKRGSFRGVCDTHLVGWVFDYDPPIKYWMHADNKNPLPKGRDTLLYDHRFRKLNLVTRSDMTDLLECEKCGYRVVRHGLYTPNPKTCLVPDRK